jgi:type IV secretion system protein VirB10
MSKKGLLAVALLILSLVAVSALSIQRFAASGKRPDADKRAGDQPTAATGEPRQLDMTLPVAVAPRIPALVPTPEERAEPIGVHRTGPAAPAPVGVKAIPPEDAPVVLVSTRPGARASLGGMSTRPGDLDRSDISPDRLDPNDPLEQSKNNLDAYQRQLQGLLESLTRTTAAATGDSGGLSSLGGTSIGLPSVGGAPPGSPTTPPSGLFGGQLQGSSTPRVAASLLGDRSLTLPKGTAFTCALKTKIVSAVSGFVGCQVQRNVFSDNGRVLLIERGSHMDGEYRIASVRPGTVRIPVLWTRIRTPNGVTVDIDSPGTGPLGESGMDGYVDNRWVERIGAALLVSLINDSVQLVIQSEINRGDNSGQ